MPRLNTPVASRPAPVDRNPTSVRVTTSTTESEDAGVTTVWTYTVPTDRKSNVGTIALSMLAEVAATTTTTTDGATLTVQLAPSGGSQATLLRLFLNGPAYVAGDTEHEAIGQGAPLDSGDVVRALDAFAGDAAGAGRVVMNVAIWTMEFDA